MDTDQGIHGKRGGEFMELSQGVKNLRFDLRGRVDDDA